MFTLQLAEIKCLSFVLNNIYLHFFCLIIKTLVHLMCKTKLNWIHSYLDFKPEKSFRVMNNIETLRMNTFAQKGLIYSRWLKGLREWRISVSRWQSSVEIWQRLNSHNGDITVWVTCLLSISTHRFFPSPSVSERKAWKWTMALCWRKPNAVLGTAAGNADNAPLFNDPNHMETHTYWIMFGGGTWIQLYYEMLDALMIVYSVLLKLCVVGQLRLTGWKPSRWWMIITLLSCQRRVWGWITVRGNNAYASVHLYTGNAKL